MTTTIYNYRNDMTSCSVPTRNVCINAGQVLVLEAQVLVLVLALGHQVLVRVPECQVLDNNTAYGSKMD